MSDFARRSRIIDIFILVILAVIAYRGWFKPGFLENGDWWVRPREALLSFFSFPYIWQSNCWFQRLGSYGAATLYIYPVFWLYGLITHLGFDFAVGERVLYFFPYLFLSLFSMYYFTYLLFKKRTICFFASLLYILNTYILALVGGGIIAIGVAYALAPLILAFFIKGLKESRFTNGLLCGFFLAVSSCYDPRITYLTIGAGVIFFIGHLWEQKMIQGLKSLKQTLFSFTCPIVALATLIILHFYWLLPSLLVQVPSLPSGYELAGGVTALSHMKLNHALALYCPFWPMGNLDFQQVKPLFYLIPLLVGMTIVFRPKDRKVILLTILAVLSVFLVKGSNPPFGGLYIWLFKHFPGFNMFRDPGKFYCLVCLAYAPLLGVGVDSLAKLIRRKIDDRSKLNLGVPLFRNAFIVFVLIFLLYLVSPVITGKTFGALQPHRVPAEYQAIEKFIRNQPPQFRSVWRPLKGRYTFYSPEYPVFPSIDPQLSLRFFVSDLYNSESFKGTKHIAKILGVLNIKYCIMPQEKYAYEIFGEQLNKDFFLSTFNQQIGLKKIDLGKNIDIFENEYYAPRFFATSHAVLVVGSRQALFELASLESLDFSRWVVFFADEVKNDNKKLLNNAEKVVFYNRGLNDLVFDLVGKDYRTDLCNHAINNDDPRQGKWRKVHPAPADTYDTLYGEITQSSGPVIYAFNQAEIVVPLKISKADTYELWLRAGTGPKNGKLGITLPTRELLKDKDLKSEEYSFQWIKGEPVYLNEGKHLLSITNKDGVGILDQLIVVPQVSLNNLRQDISGQLQSKQVIFIKKGEDISIYNDFFRVEEKKIPVTWEMINPTKYKIKLKTEKPTYLVFSETFNSYWTLKLREPISSLSAYSVINSFFIPEPIETELILEFTPQRYVYRGLWVSAIGLVLLFGYFIYKLANLVIKRNKSKR